MHTIIFTLGTKVSRLFKSVVMPYIFLVIIIMVFIYLFYLLFCVCNIISNISVIIVN